MIGRAHVILRQRLVTDVLSLPVLAALLLLGLGAFLTIRALLGGDAVTSSAWQFGAGIAPWYAGAMGVYLTAVYLPLYLTHGFTRREFMSQLPAFVAVFSIAFAGLIVLGYVIEGLVYGAAGWTQSLGDTHLYTSATQYGVIFLAYLKIALVWTLVGAVIGAAFYRSTLLGIALVPPAIAAIGALSASSRASGGGPFAGLLVAWVEHDLARATLAALLVIGIAAFGVWGLVRTLPVRTRNA